MTKNVCGDEFPGPGHVPDESARFELRFEAVAVARRSLAFPCDARGRIALDRLNDSLRARYEHARSLLGREFLGPVVVRIADRV